MRRKTASATHLVDVSEAGWYNSRQSEGSGHGSRVRIPHKAVAVFRDQHSEAECHWATGKALRSRANAPRSVRILA